MSNNDAAPVDTGTFLALRDALQSDSDALARRQRAANEHMLANHDKARAALPKHTLVAVTDFTIHDDENPLGRVVKMGDEFEVSEFDLPRFIGKGLPRAGGVGDRP